MHKKRILKFIGIILLVIILGASIGACVYVKGATHEELDLSLFKLDKSNSFTRIFVMREGEWVEWEEE